MYPQGDKLTLHEFLHTIIKNIKSIIKVTALVTIIVFIILFFIYPVTYHSVVTVLPPEKSTEMGLSSLISGQGLSGLLTGAGGNANSQLYMEILKSRTAAEYVVRKNNLVAYYNSKSELEAAEKLLKALALEVTKEGIIRLSVETESKVLPMFNDNLQNIKEFSARLSNSFIEALDSINREKLSSKARNARLYIEDQMNKTKSALDTAETELMEFQRNNKTISLPEQIEVSLNSAAKIKSEIVQTEVELSIAENNLSSDNKGLNLLKEKLKELNSQYSKLQMGNNDFLVSFKDVPELGRHLAVLLREVKIQNEVYLMLKQQYYKEKIQENRDLPTVEVLDEAVPPLKSSSPRVFFSSFSAGMVAFLIMTLFYMNKEKKFISLKKEYKKD